MIDGALVEPAQFPYSSHMGAVSKQFYEWKRFWCPREGNLNLCDSGYLVDPVGEYGRYLNPDVLAFEKIVDFQCLILLGEPGMGKGLVMLPYLLTFVASKRMPVSFKVFSSIRLLENRSRRASPTPVPR